MILWRPRFDGGFGPTLPIRQRILSGQGATAAVKAEGVSMASFYSKFKGGKKAILAARPTE